VVINLPGRAPRLQRQARECLPKSTTRGGDGFPAKLDGSAKGGIVVGIRDRLNVPVKFVGLGETQDDIAPFDPQAFVQALFEQ